MSDGDIIEVVERHFDHDYPDGQRIMKMARELVQSAAPRWISVDERLPADETPVLIMLRGEIAIGELRWEHPSHEETYESFRYWDNPSDDGQDWQWPDVTHWMLLPAAPKEQA
jgi:hypothetical protein